MMIPPLITLVGHCTDSTARIFCCAPAGNTHAVLAWRTPNNAASGEVTIALQVASPYRIGVFDLSGLPQSATVEYSVATGAGPKFPSAADLFQGTPQSFRLLPSERPLRIAFVSCNGAFQVADETRRYLLWRELKLEIDRGNVDLVVHGGDQIYADPIWIRYDSDASKAGLTPSDPERMKALTEEYRRWYVEKSWNAPDVAAVLCSVPNVMTWDDHDIFDGWGSHDEDTKSPQQAFFQAAKQTFAEFQSSHGPGKLGKTFLTGFVHNGIAVVLLDTRSERMWSKKCVLGTEQGDQLQAWARKHIDESVRRMYVVASIPPVHAKVAGALALLRIWPGQEDIEDDLRDAWTSSNNRGELHALCKWLYANLAEHPALQITVLSGDVHVAAIAEYQSRLPAHRALSSRRIYQVTSSGIGHPPPDGMGMWLIKRALAGNWVDLGTNDFQGRLITLNGANDRIFAARNFAVLRVEASGGGWEPHGNLYIDLHVENKDGKGVTPFRQVLNGPGRI